MAYSLQFWPVYSKENQMGDEKTYSEKSTSTTETKTDGWGNAQKDAGGDNVKETTTTTEGKSEGDGDSKDK